MQLQMNLPGRDKPVTLNVPDGATEDQIREKVLAIKNGVMAGDIKIPDYNPYAYQPLPQKEDDSNDNRLVQENKKMLETQEQIQQYNDWLLEHTAVDPVGPEISPRSGVMHGPNMPIQATDADPEKIAMEQERQSGLDLHTGFDHRFALGLANQKDPWLQGMIVNKYVRQNLKDAGYDVPANYPVVHWNERLQGLEYMRPVTEQDVQNGADPNSLGKLRRTFVNPAGFDWGDLPNAAPDFIQGAVEGVAATGTVAALGPTTGPLALGMGATSAAVIGGLSTPARNAILKQMYGFTDEEIAKSSNPNEALINAALAGGGELAGGVLVSTIRGFLNKGKFLRPEDVPALKKATEEQLKRLADVLAVLGDESGDALPNELVATAAGVAADNLSGAKSAVKSATVFGRLSAKKKEREAARELLLRTRVANALRRLTNEAVEQDDPAHWSGAYRQYMDSLSPDEREVQQDLYKEAVEQLNKQRGVYSLEPGAEGTLSARVHDRLLEQDLNTGITPRQPRMAQNITRAHREIQSAQDTARAAIAELPSVENPRPFVDMMDRTKVWKDKIWNWQGVLWDKFRDGLEINPRTGKAGIVLGNYAGNTTIKRALNQIQREGLNNLSVKLGAKDTSFVEDLAALRNPELDLNALHRLSSALKTEERRMAKGTPDPALGYTRENLKRLIHAIDYQVENGKWVRAGTGKHVPAVQRNGLQDLADARAATEYNKTVNENDIMTKLTEVTPQYDPATGKRVGTRFKTMPSTMRDTVMNDPLAMRSVIEATNHDPQVKQAIANEMLALYKRKVYPNGVHSPTAHDQFMHDFTDQMDMVFSDADIQRVVDANGFSAVIGAKEARLNRLVAGFKKEFGDIWPDLADEGAKFMSSDHIVSRMMNSDKINSAQVTRVMAAIDEFDHDLGAGTRAMMAQWLMDRVSSGPVLKDGNAMRALINSKGAKIGAVMGQQYMKGIRTIADALDVFDASDAAKKVGDRMQGPWLQLTRTLFGPLSRTQRFITAANRFMRARGADHMLEVLSDPTKLQEFVKLKELTPFDYTWQSTIASLGLQQFTGRYDPTQEPQNPVAPSLPGMNGPGLKRGVINRQPQTPSDKVNVPTTVDQFKIPETPGEVAPAPRGTTGRPTVRRYETMLKNGLTDEQQEAVDQRMNEVYLYEPDTLKRLLRMQEGDLNRIYIDNEALDKKVQKLMKDAKAKYTTGVGINLSDVPLTPEVLDYLFTTRLSQTEYELAQTHPEIADQTATRQMALASMHYNLGSGKLSGFEGMWKAIREGDYDRAAEEIEWKDPNNKWKGRTNYWMQTGKRARELAYMIRHDDYPGWGRKY